MRVLTAQPNPGSVRNDTRLPRRRLVRTCVPSAPKHCEPVPLSCPSRLVNRRAGESRIWGWENTRVSYQNIRDAHAHAHRLCFDMRPVLPPLPPKSDFPKSSIDVNIPIPCRRALRQQVTALWSGACLDTGPSLTPHRPCRPRLVLPRTPVIGSIARGTQRLNCSMRAVLNNSAAECRVLCNQLPRSRFSVLVLY